MMIFLKNLVEFLLMLVYKKLLPKSSTSGNDSILFINTGQIGDLTVSSIILENQAILSIYQKAAFIVKQEYLELFEDYSGTIDLLSYNYKKYKFSLLYKYKFLKKLRVNGYNKCINLTAARGILNDEMTILSGAGELYCLNSNFRYLGQFWGKILNKKYSKIVTAEIYNEYEKHYKLLNILSGNNYNDIKFKNELIFPKVADPNLPFIPTSKNIISIAPFASNPIRNWPLTNFERLIGFLNKDYLIILITSAEQETDLKKIQTKYKNVFLASGVKLNHIASILSSSIVYIGLDSGVTHIAAKMNINSVAIIGGGNFGRFFPFAKFTSCIYLYSKMECFGCDWICKFDKPYCHYNVSVDEVINAVKKFLPDNGI